MSTLRHFLKRSDNLSFLSNFITQTRCISPLTQSIRAFAADANQPSKWVPNWVKTKMPAALGGSREEVAELENLTIDGKSSNDRVNQKMLHATLFSFFFLSLIACPSTFFHFL